MMPVAIAWMLGAALLAGALTAVLMIRAKRNRPASNLVDLASARRRKARESGSVRTEASLPKRKAASSAGAEIRRFVPKGDQESLQSCSRCNKKSDSVGFYMDDYGKLVGVCKECRKSAKNRDLMPL